MGQIIEYIVLCLLLPILLLCFFLENRAKKIMFSVCFGVVACLIAYHINNSLIKVLNIDSKYYATTFAPIIEETLKFGPVLFVVLVLKKGHHASIANAFAVGLGFCIVENFYYLFNYIGEANLGWVIARCIGTGLMHSMSASIIGIGIYYARSDSKLRVLGIITSLFTAYIYHGMFNLLVDSENYVVIGAAIPAITFIIVVILLKSGKKLRLFS